MAYPATRKQDAAMFHAVLLDVAMARTVMTARGLDAEAQRLALRDRPHRTLLDLVGRPAGDRLTAAALAHANIGRRKTEWEKRPRHIRDELGQETLMLMLTLLATFPGKTHKHFIGYAATAVKRLAARVLEQEFRLAHPGTPLPPTLARIAGRRVVDPNTPMKCRTWRWLVRRKLSRAKRLARRPVETAPQPECPSCGRLRGRVHYRGARYHRACVLRLAANHP